MKDPIGNYTRSRPACSKFNIQRQEAQGLLQPIDPPIGLDWWDPAPVTSTESKYDLRGNFFSSYQFAFARLPRNPFDAQRAKFKLTRPSDYWLHLQQFKGYVIKMARSNIQQQQILVKQRYDRHRSSPVYNIRDLIWLQVLVGRSKLDEGYRSPYPITHKLGPVNYILDNGNYI
ncbi:unnamed protein product [Didymodactylos carnosus]|uniref:Uncharacterized protein n=1 Tax=Didymodactylos carnosus TaxID=1234261 RepID=A0A8S2IV64_9BILA|nr:unnamed protein product [Didymodactylos carnosus]CAF3776010.1 unnamed protein product [Didymodactylos carnosus]